MALPKTFTGGERLFAADLNDNFQYLDTELGQVGPEFTVVSSDTVNLSFDKDRVLTRTVTGNVTFTGSNYTGGRSVSVRVVGDGSSRTLSFPADWKFVSFKPTELPAGKTGILGVTSFGSSAADAVAAWAEEA
jgi:hypothetical protein